MSAWTDFAKKVMKRDKITYSQALKVASKEYKKKDTKTTTTTKKKAPVKKMKVSKSKKNMEVKE